MINYMERIDYICEKVEKNIKKDCNIIITTAINYNALKDQFSVGFFHMQNNIDKFYSVSTINSEDMCVDKIVDYIKSILKNESNKSDIIKRLSLKVNKCVCCGAPLKGLKCEYCETEYEVEV